jgi:P pilus assembly chaperone PapD
VTLELKLGATPVALAPGVATRVPVQLHNRATTPIGVRVSIARGRAAAWAFVDPADTTVEAGATATVELVLQPPADQPPSGSLVPFTVHATETATGEPAGFATGLLTVAVPIPVVGELAARPDQANVFDLRLSNESQSPTPVRVRVELDPPAGSVTAEPAALRLDAGETQTVVVRAKPARPLLGTPKPYFVVVAVDDAIDPDLPPLIKATAGGKRKPRVANWAAATAAIVLAVAATAAVALSGVRLPLPGSRRAAPPPAAPASAAVTAATTAVSRPYSLIDVFPHRGDDGGRAAAEAARTRLADAGMPVRLVDSLTSDVLADQGAGFWVLLQDGFPTIEAAQAYCTQWKLIAPKCAVTP